MAPDDRRAPGPFNLDVGSEEHYLDAALYDFEYRRRRADVNHYRRVARACGADALELGCGTGRVLLPLVRDGVRVVGVDRSAPMLRRARQRLGRAPRAARERAALVRADFRALALRRRFPLVIAAFNTMQHLYQRRDVEAFLDVVKRHLAPDGRFAFDVLNPDLRWLTRDPERRWARTRFAHPETGRRFEYTTNQLYDPVRQIAFMRIYYAALDEGAGHRPEHVVRLAHRQFFPVELVELLAANGLEVASRHGGFDGEPFDGGADSQVIVARHRRGESRPSSEKV